MLEWLEKWYRSHCNGEWEEHYGVKISTMDNPGWLVQIDISETELENRAFPEVNHDKGDSDWLICKVSSGEFAGAGDPTKLKEIMEVFKCWAENGDI